MQSSVENNQNQRCHESVFVSSFHHTLRSYHIPKGSSTRTYTYSSPNTSLLSISTNTGSRSSESIEVVLLRGQHASISLVLLLIDRVHYVYSLTSTYCNHLYIAQHGRSLVVINHTTTVHHTPRGVVLRESHHCTH